MANRFNARRTVDEKPADRAVEPAHVREIAEQDYDAEVAAAVLPVALDFFGKDSKPCETLAPRFEAVARKFSGKVLFLRISRTDSASVAARLGVTASPTIVFLQGGREKGERLGGAEIERTALKARVEALLGIPPRPAVVVATPSDGPREAT